MFFSYRLVTDAEASSPYYLGEGSEGRRYLIRRCGDQFSASLIEGDGQAVTATGQTPLHALLRAESVQLPS